jgi:hypothetical protein
MTDRVVGFFPTNTSVLSARDGSRFRPASGRAKVVVVVRLPRIPYPSRMTSKTEGERPATTGTESTDQRPISTLRRSSRHRPVTLSRWRHGFEPRWDYKQKARSDSRSCLSGESAAPFVRICPADDRDTSRPVQLKRPIASSVSHRQARPLLDLLDAALASQDQRRSARGRQTGCGCAAAFFSSSGEKDRRSAYRTEYQRRLTVRGRMSLSTCTNAPDSVRLRPVRAGGTWKRGERTAREPPTLNRRRQRRRRRVRRQARGQVGWNRP